ncbi:MAG TPA: DMT family transporter [Candidatus Limnocylindrales bacterium]|nr:DMT family transporter [Candidatus Limnocylindrales bacterium]
MHRRQVVDYVALGFIWGLSFVLVLNVVRAFGWVGAVTFRALIACALLVLLAAVMHRKLDFAGSWVPLAIVGATTVAGQLLGLSFATPRIGTAMAAIFVGSIPLFSMVIGHAWGIETISAAGRVGLILGFGGIVLLVGFPSVPITPEFLLGCAASVFGAVSAAFGSNYARRRLVAVGSWEQTIGAFLFGGLVALPLLVIVPVPSEPALADYASLVLLAGACSALAYVLYFRLVAEVGATIAVTVEFLVTVIAVAFGAVLLGERLSPVQLAGGAVIVGGCALVLDLMPWRRRPAEEASAREGGPGA